MQNEQTLTVKVVADVSRNSYGMYRDECRESEVFPMPFDRWAERETVERTCAFGAAVEAAAGMLGVGPGFNHGIDIHGVNVSWTFGGDAALLRFAGNDAERTAAIRQLVGCTLKMRWFEVAEPDGHLCEWKDYSEVRKIAALTRLQLGITSLPLPPAEGRVVGTPPLSMQPRPAPVEAAPAEELGLC